MQPASCSTTATGDLPFWPVAYLAVYVTFSLWALKDDVTRRRFGAWATVELVGVVSLVAACLAFWSCPVRSALGGGAVWLFCAGMAALTAFAANQVQRTLADAELPRHQRIWSAFLGFAVLVVVNAPLIWSGSQLLA